MPNNKGQKLILVMNGTHKACTSIQCTLFDVLTSTQIKKESNKCVHRTHVMRFHTIVRKRNNERF